MPGGGVLTFAAVDGLFDVDASASNWAEVKRAALAALPGRLGAAEALGIAASGRFASVSLLGFATL